MADHKLDAIVHKAVEHQPTLIKDGVDAALRRPKRRAAFQHVFGLRADHRRSRGIHARQLAGRRLLHRPPLRRRQYDQVRLRLRTGDASSPPAGEHDGALKAKGESNTQFLAAIFHFLPLPFYFSFSQSPNAGITLVPNSSMECITCSCFRPPKLNMPTRLSGRAVSIIERAFLMTVSGLPMSEVPHSSSRFTVKPPGK